MKIQELKEKAVKIEVKNKEYINICVASYALADTLLALNNCGVKEIYITKCDNDIYIRVTKEELETAVYGTLDTFVSCGGENIKDTE